MAVTKEIIKYTSYRENGYQVRVYDDGKILVVCPPHKTEFELEHLPEHRKTDVQPILDHIEAEKNHKFTPPEDELE